MRALRRLADRTTGWWPGLRVRTALALVATAVAACAVLTIATTSWAASQHRQRANDGLVAEVQREVDELAEVIGSHPEAGDLTDFKAAGWMTTARAGVESLLVPVDSTGRVETAKAEPYAWSGQGPLLLSGSPGCLVPQEFGGDGPGRMQENTTTFRASRAWVEECDGFLVGYGLTAGGTASTVELWMIVQAQAQAANPETDPVAELRAALTTISAGIVAAAALAALGVAAMVTRPLRRARRMAESVSRGHWDDRIPVRGRDDVARMSMAVNTMADRLTDQIADLERANEVQRRFVSDVAHEVRTPATTLLASAEALERPQSRDEAAALVVPALQRLARLTEDLLEISRMDAGRAELVKSRIELIDLIREVIDDCGAEVVYQGPPEMMLTTDPARLRVVVRNLVANALQHGVPPVTVTVARAAAGVCLSVGDAGPGVPPELRERVFDRFVRGDQPRQGPSSGLGLAIAAEYARLLGGSLSLEPDGSTFALRLPVREPAWADA